MNSRCLCYTTVQAEAIQSLNTEAANHLSTAKCLPVDHETQHGPWWSTCRCKDVFLPLYKSVPQCCCVGNLWLLSLSGPSDKKQFVMGSSAFSPYQVWCWRDWHLHQLILQEPAKSGVCVCAQWEDKFSCFQASTGLMKETAAWVYRPRRQHVVVSWLLWCRI